MHGWHQRRFGNRLRREWWIVDAGSEENREPNRLSDPRQVLILARSQPEQIAVSDAIFIIATAIFFALAILYVRACEKLRGTKS